MTEEMREFRAEISKLHDKVDTVIANQNQQDLNTQLRLQSLETAEAMRPPMPVQPCEHFQKHLQKHKEREQQAAHQAEKWSDRAWALIVRFLPTLAGALAGAAAYFAAKWSQA